LFVTENPHREEKKEKGEKKRIPFKKIRKYFVLFTEKI